MCQIALLASFNHSNFLIFINFAGYLVLCKLWLFTFFISLKKKHTFLVCGEKSLGYFVGITLFYNALKDFIISILRHNVPFGFIFVNKMVVYFCKCN
ncbi:hypothetical protein CQA40_08900 [Helicobacter sp. MIT 01-3238]|nr:hypothetical protein CQA40_08900 [Helicobacter sp. MIT 01-3238]